MTKRKSTKASSKTNCNRTPPSVPKTVKRCPDGYCTEFITHNNKSVKFYFKKISNGYLVYRQTSEVDAQRICMSADIAIAPSTRKLFEDLTTLSKAIAAVEEWLGKKLPVIR